MHVSVVNVPLPGMFKSRLIAVTPGAHCSGYGQQLSSGVSLPPRERLAMSGDIFDCHKSRDGQEGLWVLLASSGQKPGMLLNILQSTGQPSTSKDLSGPKCTKVENPQCKECDKYIQFLISPCLGEKKMKLIYRQHQL